MQIGETARDRADFCRCFKTGAAVFLHDDGIVAHSTYRNTLRATYMLARRKLSVGIRIVTFEACSGLRPAGLLNRLKRPLSRGSCPAGYPAEPLVSYQINRQLSGWNLPPLVIRAFGPHCQ